MRYILFLLFASMLHPSLRAQDRHLRNALDAINDQEYEKAKEKLSFYVSKKGATPPYFYVRYLFEIHSARTSTDLDSAFTCLSHAIEGIAGVAEKEQLEWCKEFSFCRDRLNEEFKSLDTILYNSYTKSSSVESIDEFTSKYPNSSLIRDAKQFKSHLLFLVAKKTNTEKALGEFLQAHPEAADAPAARMQMWELGFATAKKENSIRAFQLFIEKYPASELASDAENAIISLSWDQTKNINTISAYEGFIRQFPRSMQKKEAINRIWDLAWENTQRTNTKKSYIDYMTAYPESVHVPKAKNQIEHLEWKDALTEGTIKTLEGFLSAYPSSTYAPAAKRELERLEWISASQDYRLESLEAFLEKFPSSTYREEADSMKKEILNEVLPYLTRNKKYKLLQLADNRFISDQEYESVRLLKGGLFMVRQNGKTGIIDKEGKSVLLITYDCVEQLAPRLFKVMLTEKYGIVNQTGEFVIKMNYTSIERQPDGHYIASKTIGDETKYLLLDANGNILFDAVYDGLTQVNDNRYVATEKGSSFLINKKGIRIGSMKYTYITPAGNDRAIASMKNLTGVIDFNGSIIIPLKFAYISAVDSSWFIVSMPGNKRGIYSRQGEEILSPQSPLISQYIKNIFVVAQPAKTGNGMRLYLYDATSKRSVTPPIFEEITGISEGLAAFKQNNQTGYIDEAGKIILEPSDSDFWLSEEETDPDAYDGEDGEGYVEDEYICYEFNPYSYFSFHPYPSEANDISFKDGRAVMYSGGKKGYIDRKGKIVIPIIYDRAMPFMNGIANTVINGNYRIINKNGETVWEGFKINSFSEDHTFALLTEMESQELYTLDLTTSTIKKLPPGLSEYLRLDRYSIGRYKDRYVFMTRGGKMLMDDGIDFSDYEANQLLSAANAAYFSEEYNEAIRLFMRALKYNEKKAECLMGLSKCHAAKKDYSNAVQYLDELVALQPDNAYVYEERGILHYENNEFSNALEDFKNALEYTEHPSANLYFRMAYCESQQGNRREAIQFYTESIKLNANSMSYNNRGICHENSGEQQLALKDYSSAISNAQDANDEQKGMYYNNRGALLISMKRKTEACKDFQKAASLGNENAKNSLRIHCR